MKQLSHKEVDQEEHAVLNMRHSFPPRAAFSLLWVAALITASGQTAVQVQKLTRTTDVDPRYISFNIEAVEVTGGNFWKPYEQKASGPAAVKSPDTKGQNTPTGMDAGLLQYRGPIDLSNPRLRKLAVALSPAFLRVSGTWRNSTYFQDNDLPPAQNPPEGYKGVMTRAEWKGVVDFSHAVHADLVTSVATSAGARNSEGVWTPAQAKAFFDYTQRVGGHITATEFMNEPTFAAVGGAPKGYDGAAFARDVKLFAAFLKKESPDTLLLGPGSIGEGVSLVPGAPAGTLPGFVKTEDMLRATGPIFDAFSYHFYATISKRCAGPAAVNSDQALTPEWLQRNLTVEEFYSRLRDQYLPGKPIWLTETGEAGCGGDSWAHEFLDVFRFMDQLGSLAQKGVKSVMVNTLASSDYGLLDEETLEPRPNYWAAVLWKKSMGSRVLDPGVAPSPTLRIYSHCSVLQKGSVSLLILNLDRSAEQDVEVLLGGEQYALTSDDLLSSTVKLNGATLHSKQDGSLPRLSGRPFPRGSIRIAPLSINFLVFAKANNASCK